MPSIDRVRKGIVPGLLASLLAYTALTCWTGRHVLANLSTHVASDDGDPLLTAAILHWNAHHVPFTDTWLQFPIFHPTRDALAFSEHLLGLTVVAAPIDWITGDPLVTHNLVVLLTFVLSAAAMYGLVYRLTGSAAGAFVAGLAFGFAPFRISQLPHVQMLASFWTPLALLGLHAFLESGRRRWLVVYGGAWLLQAAASGYSLVSLSVLVALWVLWFVIVRRRWRELGLIALATGVAALPLLPIVRMYTTVLARHGFARGLDEVRHFSADVASVLCARPALSLWGWLRVGCREEGELFPGLVLSLLVIGALVVVLRVRRVDVASRAATAVTWASRVLLAIAALYATVILSIAIVGPWRLDWPFLRIAAESPRKPLIVGIVALVAGLLLSPGARASVRHGSTSAFYLLAALVTWLFALGPAIMLMGDPIGYPGPFALLLELPGGSGVRVPARFWLMTTACLSAAAGVFVASVLATRSRAVTAAAVVVLGAGLASDGWIDGIAIKDAPARVPDARALEGRLVVELPMTTLDDIAAQYRAVAGGWRSVNGYSGFRPRYYDGIKMVNDVQDESFFRPFQRDEPLHVIVRRNRADLLAFVAGQPGAERLAGNAWAVHYRLPMRPSPAVELGAAVPIVGVSTGCESAGVRFTLDRDETTRWICPPTGMPQELVIDFGRPTVVSSYGQSIGQYSWEGPPALRIETSLEGGSWREAWRGGLFAAIVDGALRDPKSLRVVVPFPTQEARYVRVRPERTPPGYPWTIAELEVGGR